MTHHEDIIIDTDLAARLVSRQFPHWAHLSLQPVASAGTDNALFALGSAMVVRLPRVAWASSHAGKEHRWLPRLAPHLPLSIPVPLARGEPDEGYPWNWSVCNWLEGEDLHSGRLGDPVEAARGLGNFIAALHSIDAAEGPLSGKHNNYRGVPLTVLDGTVCKSLGELEGKINVAAAAQAWDAALAVPEWSGPPVWVHGDLHAGNILCQEGRLSSVIDFGLAGVGDPACDMIVGWNLFEGRSREAFRAAVGVDDETWARGRGWALYTGLVALPFYLNTNPVIVRTSRHVIGQVLADLEDRL